MTLGWIDEQPVMRANTDTVEVDLVCRCGTVIDAGVKFPATCPSCGQQYIGQYVMPVTVSMPVEPTIIRSLK